MQNGFIQNKIIFLLYRYIRVPDFPHMLYIFAKIANKTTKFVYFANFLL